MVARFSFSTDEEVKSYVADILRARGERVELNKQSPRPSPTARIADIVTRDTVIIVKSVLNPEKIYQGLGRAVTCARLLGLSKVKVMGPSPADPGERAESDRLKEYIEMPGRGRFSGSIEVIFIDRDPDWVLRPVVQRRVGVVELTLLVVAALVLVTAGIDFARQGSYSQPPPAQPKLECDQSLPNC